MTISVHFIGKHRFETGSDSITIPLDSVKSVSDVLHKIMKSHPHLSISENAVIATVNDEIAKMTTELKANDSVSFLPVIGGG